MAPPDAKIVDLRHRLDAAYEALRELEEDLAAGRISTADHAALTDPTERHAASLLTRLRAVERDAGRVSRARENVAERPRRAPFGSPVAMPLGGVALVIFGVVLGVLVARFSSDERPAADPAPARQSTRAPGVAGPVSPALEALRREATVETAPTKTTLAFAHVALDEGQLPAAITAYRRVLDREPKNAEALTHMGVILYQAGHVDEALARIEEALAVDPAYAHARWDHANAATPASGARPKS
jgi:tetratricopeptide (TPR) repeat protein